MKRLHLPRWLLVIPLAVVAVVLLAVGLRLLGFRIPNWQELYVAGMDRASNQQVTFFGRVVDQDGVPVADATVAIFVFGTDPDWAWRGGPDKRGSNRLDEFRTNANGAFTVSFVGSAISVRDVRADEYEWFHDAGYGSGNDRRRSHGWDRMFYFWYRRGMSGYLPDPARPAQFVLVRQGVTAVSAFPSRGGTDIDNSQVITNVPMWPIEPSLKGVHPAQPTTAPSAARGFEPANPSKANIDGVEAGVGGVVAEWLVTANDVAAGKTSVAQAAISIIPFLPVQVVGVYQAAVCSRPT